MFADPVFHDLDMYLKQHERVNYLINHTEEEMKELYKDAKIRAKSLVHPEFVDDFLEILSNGYWEEMESALRIAKQLGLNQKHFFAIDGNESGMQNTLKQEAMDDEHDSSYYD